VSWTRILYGTLIAAGLATSGTLVWNAHRPQVKARDFIALFQATQERCLATEYVAGTNAANTVTNKVKVFAATDPSGLWFVDEGRTNLYKTVSGTNDEVRVYTNSTASFRVDPINRSKTYHTATTNRYIWGPYSNYVVAGISGGIGGYGTHFNGTYRFFSRSRKMVDGATYFSAIVDEYWKDGTNTYRLYDYGPQEGQSFSQKVENAACVLSYRGASRFYTAKGDAARFGPWHAASSIYGSVASMSIVASDLLTNMLRDAPVCTSETEQNTIDQIISRTLYVQLSAKIHDALGLNEVFLPYMDDAQATSGEFQNFTNLPGLTSTGVWASLSLPLIATNTVDGTKHGLFNDEYSFQNGSILGINPTGWVVRASNWTDRVKVLAAIKWTHSGENGNSNYYGCSWSTNLTENYWVWSGYSADSWSAAKSECAAAEPIKYTSAIRPLRGTSAYKDAMGNWCAFAYAAVGQLIVACNTQVEHSGDVYYRAQTYGTNSFTNSTFADGGTGLQDGYFKRLETGGSGWGGSVTSSVVGSTDFPTTWCDEPTDSASKSAGWEINMEDAVIKWNFQYCTNSP
jgi:hypothetical protein